MRPNLVRSILGGLVGTMVLTMMMYFVAPKMTGQRVDIAAMLGSTMGNSWMLGMIGHFVLGSIAFPLVYVFFVYGLVGSSPVVKGTIWGGVLWFVAQAIVMPMMGAGFFSSSLGGMKPAVASLIGHLTYGAILGGVTGGIDSPLSVKT